MRETEALSLSVIIPSHNASSLEPLLSSIQGQICSFNYEVLVIANPPCQKLCDCISKYPKNFRYLSTKKVGANSARNVGLNEALGDFSYFLDDDCLLPNKDHLQKVFENQLKFPKSLVGGNYAVPETASSLEKIYNFIQNSWLSSGLKGASQKSQYLLGGNFSGPAPLLKNYLFDENLTFGGTETELFFRLQKTGTELLLIEDLAVLHSSSLSFQSYLKKAYRQGQGRSYIELKGLTESILYKSYLTEKIKSQLKKHLLHRIIFESYGLFFHVGATLFKTQKSFLPHGLCLILQVPVKNLCLLIRRRLELFEKIISARLNK